MSGALEGKEDEPQERPLLLTIRRSLWSLADIDSYMAWISTLSHLSFAVLYS
jgi:hypothetical protein